MSLDLFADEPIPNDLDLFANEEPPELIAQTSEMERTQIAEQEEATRESFRQKLAESQTPLEAFTVSAGRGVNKLMSLFGITDDEDPNVVECSSGA